MVNVSDEIFLKVVTLVRDCLDKGFLRLRFLGGADAPLLEIINRISMDEAIQSAEINVDMLNEVWRAIPDMLRNILTKTEEFYIAKQLSTLNRVPSSEAKAKKQVQEEKQKLDAEQAEQIRNQFTIIRNNLITPRILQRYALKSSAPTAFLRRCSGEISNQIYNSLTGKEGGLYANVQFWTEDSEVQDIGSILFSMYNLPSDAQSARKKITITCDESDLDSLIEILTNLRDRLKGQIKAEANDDESK